MIAKFHFSHAICKVWIRNWKSFSQNSAIPAPAEGEKSEKAYECRPTNQAKHGKYEWIGNQKNLLNAKQNQILHCQFRKFTQRKTLWKSLGFRFVVNRDLRNTDILNKTADCIIEQQQLLLLLELETYKIRPEEWKSEWMDAIVE